MKMAGRQLSAYQEVEQSTVSGRDLEALALTNAAMRLIEVRNAWNEAGCHDRLDDALRLNQRLWTVFQTEVASPENALPLEIKNNLLSLSVFVDKRTFEIYASPEPEKLDVLIRINQEIAAGLRAKLDVPVEAT